MITKNEYTKKKTTYDFDIQEIKNLLNEDKKNMSFFNDEERKLNLLKQWAFEVIKKDIDVYKNSDECNFDIEALK